MKKLLILAALAGTGVVCALLATGQRDRELNRNFEVNQRRQVARWSLGGYVPITNVAEIREGVLARMQVCDTNGLLADGLREKLAASILALCRTYSSGDFDAFVAFRLPAPEDRTFEIAPDQLDRFRKVLPDREVVEAAVRAGRSQGVDRPVSLDGPLGVLEAWWYAKALNVQGSPESSESFFCLNRWREFAPNRFSVLVERRQRPPLNLMRIANRLEPMSALFEIHSMLTARPTAEELLGEGKPVLFAHCLVPVKLDHRIKARPVLVSFYWCETYDKFLPHRLAVPAADRTVYYVF